MGDESVVGDQDYFLRGWQTYRQVLDLNYMSHREVYDLLHRVLVAEAPARFRFLDIACGDAAATVTALRGTDVGSYAGIDISRQALAIARDELAALSCPVTLVEGDLRPALAGWRDPVDVAWIGQSLHHFQPEGKLEVMRQVHRLLGPGGLFLIWEPTTLPGEDRHGWAARIEAAWRPIWTAGIGAEAFTTMIDHTRASDYPETAADWVSLGREAGFGSGRELLTAPEFARVYCFRD